MVIDNATAKYKQLCLRMAVMNFFLLGTQQIARCSGQENGGFLPEPKVKTQEPRATTPTPVPVIEQEMWGLRMWQVAGLALVLTVVLITCCCCFCDCRIPKTRNNNKDVKPPKDDSDEEPAAVQSGQHPKRDKDLTNSSVDIPSHRNHLWNTQALDVSSERRLGEENMAFNDHEGTPGSRNSPRCTGPPNMSLNP